MQARLNDNVAGHIVSFLERVERIEEEVKELNAQKSDVYKEAKAMGFNTKIIKRLVARRRRSADQLAEEDFELQLYMDAVERWESHRTTGDPLDN